MGLFKYKSDKKSGNARLAQFTAINCSVVATGAKVLLDMVIYQIK
jgi:hypothetical protein